MTHRNILTICSRVDALVYSTTRALTEKANFVCGELKFPSYIQNIQSGIRTPREITRGIVVLAPNTRHVNPLGGR